MGKITLTDGKNSWNIEEGMYNMYVLYESCESCKNYLSGNCGNCLSGEENNYKEADKLESKQIIEVE
jgi:hypothetical protein